MFSFRCASRTIQPISWSSLRSCNRRSISSSFSRFSDLAPEPPAAPEPEGPVTDVPPEVQQRGGLEEEKTKPETYNQFLADIGHKFKKAQPRNWLGGEVVEFVLLSSAGRRVAQPRVFSPFEKPFPMNPSFKPPAPISDAQRTKMYTEFMKDPKANNVRALSQRYHLSLKRVEAILRLKGMEEAWIKGKTLQTGFLVGMEKILGVKQEEQSRNSLRAGETDWTRYDVHEADTLEEEEKRDAARQRYQRQYWESVPEDGSEPVAPTSLEEAKAAAKRFTSAAERAKSDPKLMPHVKDSRTITSPRKKIQEITKPGRPILRFVDVGGKFIDVGDRRQRIASGERRARMKSRR